MPLIGVRELRQRTTEVLRQVQEEKTEFVITYRGRPIGRLLPVDAKVVEAAIMASEQAEIGGWDAYDRAVERARRVWPAERKADEILDEVRR